MILTLGELKDVSQLVLACGCFDVLTIGHVRHLKAAKSLGQALCVLVTADRYVNKPKRPIFGEAERAEVIDSLRFVDYTIVNQYPTAVETIRLLRPAIYVKGKEYKNAPTERLCAEQDALETAGGKLLFTDGLEVHTTDALKRLGL